MKKSKKDDRSIKIALVYDHFTTKYGGAELVLQSLHQIFPDAPLYTTVYKRESAYWAQKMDIRPSFLQKLPFIKYQHHVLAPLHPLAFESHDLSKYNVIISVTSGAAKGIVTLPHQLHICYLLTPTRYLLALQNKDSGYVFFQNIFRIPGIKKLTVPFFNYLKRWDQVAAWRPDKVIAISQLVADRSLSFYNRRVDTIIYPPFSPPLNRNANKKLPQPFLLCLSRLVSYKKIDLAIQAAIKNNETLLIAGEGNYKAVLETVAGKHGYSRLETESIEQALTTVANKEKLILFLGSCTNQEKQTLLFNCSALLMLGEEDFGLTGLEATAYGKPVVTFYKSGISEILKNKIHAIHITDQTVQGVTIALRQLQKYNFSKRELIKYSEQYTVSEFKKTFHNTIYQFWQQHSTISPVKLV